MGGGPAVGVLGKLSVGKVVSGITPVEHDPAPIAESLVVDSPSGPNRPE